MNFFPSRKPHPMPSVPRDGEIYRNAGVGFEFEEFGIVFETPNPNQAYYPEDYKRDADPVLLCFHVLVTLNVTFISPHLPPPTLKKESII